MAVARAAHVIGDRRQRGVLAVRIARGLVPAAARRIVDVGPSFVVVGALVTTIVAGGGLAWRVAAALGFGVLVPSLFDGLTEGDVAAVGHVVSIGVGLAAGAALLLRARRARSSAQAVPVSALTACRVYEAASRSGRSVRRHSPASSSVIHPGKAPHGTLSCSTSPVSSHPRSAAR